MPNLGKEETEWFKRELYPHEAQLRSWLAERFHASVPIDDFIQEAYIRTIKRQRNKYLSSPKAFLFATARNLCLDFVRRSKILRFESLGDDQPIDALDKKSKGIPEKIIEREEFEIMSEAIQSLPDKCRRIITLRKVYGMPLKQISKELNISLSTVEVQLWIGMKKCKKYYQNLVREYGK